METRSKKLPEFAKVLSDYVRKKKQVSASFKQDDFAKRIGISKSSLSSFLVGRFIPSIPTARKIAQAMALDPAKERAFVFSVAQAHRQAFPDQDNREVNEVLSQGPIKLLEPAAVLRLNHWYHYAIVCMAYRKDFDAQPESVARELGISPEQARNALDTLFEIGILSRDGDGRVVGSQFSIRVPDDQSVMNQRNELQVQHGTNMIRAFQTLPQSARAFRWLMIIGNNDDVLSVRERMDRFAVQIENEFSDPSGDSVYQLNLSYHKVSRS